MKSKGVLKLVGASGSVPAPAPAPAPTKSDDKSRICRIATWNLGWLFALIGSLIAF